MTEQTMELVYVDGKWTIDNAATAGMTHAQRGFMSQIEKFKIGNVPVGTPLVGGSIALLASEVVDGFLATQQPDIQRLSPWIKIGVAWAVIGMGGDLLGRDVAHSAASFLVFDATRKIVPVDDWIKQILQVFTPGKAANNNDGGSHQSHNPGAGARSSAIRMVSPMAAMELGVPSLALNRNALAGV